MHDPTRDTDWSLVEAQLPAGWRELATEMRLIRKLPKHIGQKILDIEVVLRLVLHYVSQQGSMRQTIAGAAASGLVSFSQVAFVERPGATGTTARLHYALQLSTLSPRAIRITDETGGETMRNFDPEEGELWILDRGYSNPPCVETVLDAKADILVRLNRHSMPLYTAAAMPIDVATLLRCTTDRGCAHERKVYVHTKSGRMLAARLCWIRLLPDDARKARAHAKREGAKDDGEFDLYEYIAIITTADASRINTSQVLDLYRARWQIELNFKRDKSLGELDRLPSLIPDLRDPLSFWITNALASDRSAMS